MRRGPTQRQTFERAVSLFTAIKHLKGHDCSNFIKHLSDAGVEVLCAIIHYILNGQLELSPRVRGRLKSKIKSRLKEIKKLAIYTEEPEDISKKRKVLQRGGIVGILSVIASVVVPLITRLLIQ